MKTYSSQRNNTIHSHSSPSLPQLKQSVENCIQELYNRGVLEQEPLLLYNGNFSKDSGDSPLRKSVNADNMHELFKKCSTS